MPPGSISAGPNNSRWAITLDSPHMRDWCIIGEARRRDRSAPRPRRANILAAPAMAERRASMPRPVIGLTAGRRNLYTEPDRVQEWLIGCDADYVESVARSGGTPVLLPRVSVAGVFEASVDRIDGLLLTGGGDVMSFLYGEEPHRTSRGQDPVRDEMEFQVLKLALERGIPVLGICRGIQVINVAFGGTLIQDIPSQIPESVLHWTNATDSVLCHTVTVEEDSMLAKVLGTTKLATNSWHHQCIGRVGQGLRVNCRATDGVIEGVESSSGLPILAVQFHPEESSKPFPIFQKLFDWLVQEATGYSRCRR